MFELLTGEKPFRGNSRMLLQQVMHDDAPSLRRLDATVSRDLETVCLKCLEKDPGRRYQSATALAIDLQNIQDGKPIHARPVSKPERFWRWCCRETKLAALLLTISMALVICTTLALLAMGSAEDAKLARHNETQKSQLAHAAQIAADRSLYIAEMQRVAALWRDGDKETASSLLEKQIPGSQAHDHRSFDWYYYWRLVHHFPDLSASADKESTDILTGAEGVYHCLFSPNGRTVASLNWGTPVIALWDADSGLVKNLCRGHSAVIMGLDFSDDGNWIASGSDDGSVRLWNTNDGTGIAILGQHASEVRAVAFIDNSRLLVSYSLDGRLRVWDVLQQECIAIHSIAAKPMNDWFPGKGPMGAFRFCGM